MPSESAVWREESLLLERKRRYCAACRGQAQPVLQPRRDALVFRSDDSEYCPSPCAGRYCSNRDNTDLRFPLSSPGPLYLAFLEEYKWDIDIFAESLNFQGPAHGNDAYLSEHDRINERDRKKPDVIWKISTYAVRPFLQKLDAIILNDCGCGTDSNPSLSSAPTPPIEAKNSLAHMMLAKSGLRKIFPFIGSKNKQVKRRLYGEIPQGPDKTKLRTGTKCGLGKEARSAVLLWTIVSGRVEGLASSSPISTSPTSTTVGAPLLEREVTVRSAFYSYRVRGLTIIGTKVYKFDEGHNEQDKGDREEFELGSCHIFVESFVICPSSVLGKEKGICDLEINSLQKKA